MLICSILFTIGSNNNAIVNTTITIKNLDKPLYFYYRIIAENSTSSVSKLSDLATLELEQDAQDISLYLEKYDYYFMATIF